MVTPDRLIDPVQLPSAVAVLYTAPAGRRAIIKKMICVNNDPGPGSQMITFYRVPMGGTPGVANDIIPVSVAPLSTEEIYLLENATLRPGDTLQGFATTAAVVTLHLDGLLVDM